MDKEPLARKGLCLSHGWITWWILETAPSSRWRTTSKKVPPYAVSILCDPGILDIHVFEPAWPILGQDRSSLYHRSMDGDCCCHDDLRQPLHRWSRQSGAPAGNQGLTFRGENSDKLLNVFVFLNLSEVIAVKINDT